MSNNPIIEEASSLLDLAEKYKNLTQDNSSYADSQQAVLSALDQYHQKLLKAHVTYKKIIHAKYAIAAYIDETVFNSACMYRLSWKGRPLQVILFNEYLAGEVFFSRLELLREEVVINSDVIELYYLCLKLGFKGKYSVQAGEQFCILLDEVYQDICSCRENDVATTLFINDQKTEFKKPGLMTRLIVPNKVVFYSMLISAFLYIGFYIDANHHLNRAKTEIKAYGRMLSEALEHHHQ